MKRWGVEPADPVDGVQMVRVWMLSYDRRFEAAMLMPAADEAFLLPMFLRDLRCILRIVRKNPPPRPA